MTTGPDKIGAVGDIEMAAHLLAVVIVVGTVHVTGHVVHEYCNVSFFWP